MILKSAIDRLERELFELYGDMETIREHILSTLRTMLIVARR